jgi:hypothetical protein
MITHKFEIKYIIFFGFLFAIQHSNAQRFKVIDTTLFNDVKRIRDVSAVQSEKILADSGTANRIGRFAVQESKRYRLFSTVFSAISYLKKTTPIE